MFAYGQVYQWGDSTLWMLLHEIERGLWMCINLTEGRDFRVGVIATGDPSGATRIDA